MSRKRLHTEEFILNWQRLVCLWDATSREYRDKDARVMAVRELAQKCEMTENEVKVKINTLRSYYSKELTKIQSSKMNGAEEEGSYVSKWPYFNLMSFIRGTIRRRRPISSPVDSPLEESDKEEELFDEIETFGNDGNGRCTGSDRKYTEATTKKPLLKRAREVTGSTDNSVTEKPATILRPSKERALDEDDIYGQTIAFSMRRIKDHRRKSLAKIKIQEILYEAEFGQHGGSLNPDVSHYSLLQQHHRPIFYAVPHTFQPHQPSAGQSNDPASIPTSEHSPETIYYAK